jgi:hypothetical protein
VTGQLIIEHLINFTFINNDVLIASRQYKNLSTLNCLYGYIHTNLPKLTYYEISLKYV